MDSRRYHRQRPPTFTRGISAGGSFSESSSRPAMFDPFGGMPFSLAHNVKSQFSGPLSQGFGYQGGQGPLGTFINQAQGTAADYIPALQGVSQQITSGANSAYGGYQAAIDNFMKQLPGFQSNAAGATAGAQQAQGAASTALQDAMSPLQSRASFQEASRRALAPTREAAAARGMLEGGQAQAGEQSLLSDLAFKALSGDRDAQQQAIAGLTGASQGTSAAAANQAGVAGLGPQMQQALFSAFPQLAQLLTGAAQLPQQGANDLLSFLTATQNPTYELLKMVLPQMGQKSKSLSLAGQGSVG